MTNNIFHSELLESGLPIDAVMSIPSACCDDLSFRMYFLPCPVILRLAEIPRHEHIFSELVSYSAAELKVNGVGNRSIFVSHRWVSGKPDSDDHAQLEYIKETIQLFDNHEHMLIWIDYSCMKQDSPDLPTIRRLNYILSYCDLFMIVLPATDPLGYEYVKRVWCIYEWISVLHFKKMLIMPNSDISAHLLRHTLDTLLEIVVPDALRFLETARIHTRSQIDRLAEYISMCQFEQSLLGKDKFISKLQAFDERDKEFVFDNLSSYFTLTDLLFIFISGGSSFSLQTISVKDTNKGCIYLNAMGKYLSDLRRGSAPSSSLSSLDLGNLSLSDDEE